jgi:hypothetical protein
MLEVPEIGKLNGIVIGRSDLTGSMGFEDKKCVDSDQIFEITKEIIVKAKNRGLECVIGGTVTATSIPFFQRLPAGFLDRFETRKVCFNAKKAFEANALDGINKALYFEMLWLQNKSNFYKEISEEDNKRLKNLEARFR